MEVMTNYRFFDDDIKKVLRDGHENNREIVLKSNNQGSIIINKEDVVALAKEFNLVVYEKDSCL